MTHSNKTGWLHMLLYGLDFGISTLIQASGMYAQHQHRIAVCIPEQRSAGNTQDRSRAGQLTLPLPREYSLKASLTSSAKVFFSVWMTKSTTDTLGVGTRRAMPAHCKANVMLIHWFSVAVAYSTPLIPVCKSMQAKSVTGFTETVPPYCSQ